MTTATAVSNGVPSTPTIKKDRAVCLAVDVEMIGNTRQVSNSLMEGSLEENNIDSKLIRVHKHLLDSPELKAIRKRNGEGRRWLYDHSLPSLFKSGVYRLPVRSIAKAEAYFVEWENDIKALVKQFKAAYPALVATSRQRLGAAFNPADYPDVKKLAAMFSVSHKYVSFETPDSLMEVSAEFYEQERQKAAVEVQVEQEMCVRALRERTADLVNHLIERLTGDKDGKPKIFRNSMITNINEFIANFRDGLNDIGEDSQLSKEIAKMESMLKGVNADKLRESDSLREQVKAGFENIKAKLDTMLQDKPKRAIYIDDEAA